MRLFKVKGVVIKDVLYKDNDKIITLMTDKFGKISCMAKGAKKTNSALLGPCQLFVCSEFVLYKGKSFYHINSAEVINTFYNLRSDLDKIDSACEITKILNSFTFENQESSEVLSLYLNTLYMTANIDKDLKFILNVFKLKLLGLSGFVPKFNRCKTCGEDLIKNKKETNYLSVNTNHVICEECKNKQKQESKQEENKIQEEYDIYEEYIKVSEPVLFAINYVLISETKNIFKFELTKKSFKEFESLVDRMYINLIY